MCVGLPQHYSALPYMAMFGCDIEAASLHFIASVKPGGRLISATHHPSAVVSDANACTQASRDGVVLYIIRLFNRPESFQ